MLVAITRGPTKPGEEREILTVGDDGERDQAVHVEPLGALPPLREGDGGAHFGVVAATARGPRAVERFDEGGRGAGEVGVDGREVEERDARFREEEEVVV